MAVGEASFPAMPAIEGIRLGTSMAGIKAAGRRDLVVIELPEATTLAAAFTRNAFCAAPVHVARRHLETDRPRYLLINTGNANAGTGEQGMHDAEQSCQALGELTGVAAQCVLPFSTGVIGEPLPVTRLCDALPEALAALSADGWKTAGEGILTTDTRAKGATTCIEIDGQLVTINGIAKGSGMIKPDMATMLSFVFTDAAIDDARLQVLLRRAVDESFNCITVDSDTSTNDACTLAATGRGARIDTDEHESRFAAALTEVLVELAQAIIRDAEGATKFVTLEVEGATDRQEALDVAFTVAHSPLVKTALYASDANWGRILAAVGRAPVPDLDVSRISIDLGDVALVERGGRAASYTEAAGSAVMAESEITIRIHLGRGDVAATVWTSDLSHDYVSINADYRS